MSKIEMLSVVFFMSLLCQGLSVVSFGKEFITAFPENIAFYFPQDSRNALKITAFHNDTIVTVTFNFTDRNITLHSGQTNILNFPKDVEVCFFMSSQKSVKIVSNKIIVVLWISQRGDSVQTNVVQPTPNLGTRYSIAALNYNAMTASSIEESTLFAQNSLRYGSVRLIIINAMNITNTISVQIVSTNGQKDNNFTLSPYELYQFSTSGSATMVYSSNKVALLLTHPCAETTICGCNMVVSQILPMDMWGNEFVVPSLRNMSTAWLHVTSTTKDTDKNLIRTLIQSNSSELIPFPDLDVKSQYITAPNNVSLRLISPGIIIELIPVTMFGACFLVQFNSTQGEAFVIAEDRDKHNVHIDNGLLSTSVWRNISKSNYSTKSVPLDGTHIIWHPTSKIGVYMFERMVSGIVYGGPAILLNEQPDHDGCVAEGVEFITATDLMTWPESHQYCLNGSYQMFSPTNKMAQDKMTMWLQKNANQEDIWIGLRRSLLTEEWYWQIGNESVRNVNYTLWADGHPVEPQNALCASVSPQAGRNFFWKSVRCCFKLRPVCFKSATYFNEITFEMVDFNISAV
ncbi:IgGFc-binding protein-like isoform X1 [Xyrauchen texanus]|uniref:IgGFc-binding protein-like isoform X1 n=1 Tax=Xyrauchen texanus TaxID=154827 RepID=UPI002241FEFB|nr:IgGFc-binding protein-like isoform X1 [Xyrauchen texanus]XP_052000356.1 IgGFc-binding protein-like isoform X1 [Xyrauchen texanus]